MCAALSLCVIIALSRLPRHTPRCMQLPQSPGPPPPNLSPSPAPLRCLGLTPKGIPVTLKRPALLCLTTCVFVHRDANVSPLILFCHLTLTPTGAPLGARHSTLWRHLCQPVPTGRFQYVSFLLSVSHCVLHRPFAALFLPLLHDVAGNPCGVRGVPLPHQSLRLKTFSFCLWSCFCVVLTPGNNPRGFEKMEFK